MDEFKVIETQEQFDAAVAEEVKKARDAEAKKYEGWTSPADLEKMKTDHQTAIDQLNGSLTEANEKIANHAKDMAVKDSTIKKNEMELAKIKIAHETGLSYDAVQFLKGEDEAAIKESAESLKGLVGANNVPPLANVDTIPEDTTKAALKNTLDGLKGE